KLHYGIAAAALFVLSVSVYLYRANSLTNNQAEQRVLFESITAGTDKAVLELANGEQVLLDGSTDLSVNNGNIMVGGRRINLQNHGIVSTAWNTRSEEHTSELQSRENLVCRLLLDKK